MKLSRSQVRRKAFARPELKFEHQSLTSFGGLFIFQELIDAIGFKRLAASCFDHLQPGKIFSPAIVLLQLIVHITLGFRDLRESYFYRDDPMIKRILGLTRLPDAATLSRTLAAVDDPCIAKLRRKLRKLVLERLVQIGTTRITLDFDGSVQSTGRKAEGAAVGFNNKKKGARSYYPLFCTVAQTGQVLDFLHRSGNVHDSKGAREFIQHCIEEVRRVLPGAAIEVRMDSAFFSDQIVTVLQGHRVEFTISVPFERFVELKGFVEDRKRWHGGGKDVSFFEKQWRPRSWDRSYRFLFVRTRVRRQQKGPVQLDLFVPHEFGYEFKVIVTNKNVKARSAVKYHEGRGSQEGIFGDLKRCCQMGHVPVRTRNGNQLYLLAGIFAHNLNHELQMRIKPPERGRTIQRATLYVFEKLSTLRRTLFCRAGRFSRPNGTLTLTISGGNEIEKILRRTIDRLRAA